MRLGAGVLLCLLVALLGEAGAAVDKVPTVLKIPKPQPDSQAAQCYYLQLLRLALEKTVASHGPYRLEAASDNGLILSKSA